MKMQAACYYCNSEKTYTILEIGKNFSVLKCTNCSLVYSFPRSKLNIKEINNKKYNSKSYQRSYMGIFGQIYSTAKKYVKNIQKYKKSGKYLDIGCSYGVYLKAAKESGFDTYGIEIASNAANYAKKKFHLNVFIGTVQKAKFKANSFDVITLYDVLEHISDIKIFLKEIFRITKPGGILVIQYPNSDSLAFKILEKDWNWLLVPEHLWHFSIYSLSIVLKDNGFKVIGSSTRDNLYDFASNWVTRLGLTAPHKTLFKKFLRKSVYYMLYFGIALGSNIWSRFNKGGSLLIYAQK